MAVRCTILFFGTGTVLPLGTDASLPSMVAVTWSPTLRVGFRVGLLAKFAVTSTFLLGIVKVALVGSFLSGVRKVSAFCSSSPTFTVQPVKCCPSGAMAVRCTVSPTDTALPLGTDASLPSMFAVTWSPMFSVGFPSKFAFISTFSAGMTKLTLAGSFASGVRKSSGCLTPFTFTVQPVKRSLAFSALRVAVTVSPIGASVLSTVQFTGVILYGILL